MTGRHAITREAALTALDTPAGRGLIAAMAFGTAFGVALPAANATEQTSDKKVAGVLSVSETETSHKVWGQGTIKKTYKDTEVMVAFLARERNDTTERLARPGNHEPFLLALETREAGRVYRKITKEHAVAKRNGDVTDNEDALSGIPLQATILPDTTIDANVADRYWDIQDSAATGS